MSIELLVIVVVAFAIFYFHSEGRLKRLENRLRKLESVIADGVPLQTPDDAERIAAEGELAEASPGPWGASASAGEAEKSVDELPETAEIPQPAAARMEAEVDIAESAPRESLESRIGARWPVWVGGLALGLGGIFMVKYSIESGLLSPVVRLTLACLFGVVLLVGGEWLRRREKPLDIPTIRNALIPGVLTAAGVVTLFGAVFAANAIYGYIGPGPAFGLLAAISLSAIALSLLHGQAFAGLGLLASMITPALVDTETPNAWALFVYLSIAWLATNFASRLRQWNAVPTIANVALLLWAVTALLDDISGAEWAVVTGTLVMTAGLAFIWPAGDGEIPKIVEDEAEQFDHNTAAGWRHRYRASLSNAGHRWISISGAVSALFVALVYLSFEMDGRENFPQFAVIIAALGFAGAWRRSGFPATIATALGVLLSAVSYFSDFLSAWDGPFPDGEIHASEWSFASGTFVQGFILAIAFLGFGLLAQFRHARRSAAYALSWVFMMVGAPLALLTASFVAAGTFSLDWPHGLSGLGLTIFYLVLAEWLSRSDSGSEWAEERIGLLTVGSYLALVLALHAFTESVVTTILTAVAGFAYLYAIRFRPWPILPWIMGLAGIVVLARIGWQPSLVGDLSLSKTPFFNQLLPGYGIPAVLMGLGAYLVRDWPAERVRNFLQALASLMALMTVAVLVRHALNGGSLHGGAPSLGEQSIYTLLTVGGSAVLMTLDMKSPSPVFRWGSMLVGGVSLLSALFAHLFGLNPFITGELTGKYPLFNLLLLGYLLPSMAFLGLAYYARGKRPMPYVRALAIAGAVLAFTWITLSVRRFWQGPGIAEWKGFLQPEMYTYSVVWLTFGVALLALGSRFNAVSLRLASAVLVLVAVLKVFLVDMSNLQGFLRALSFIGLGAVLIGIGLFYQRILARRPAGETQ